MAGKSDIKVAFISDEVAADPDGISASAQVANNAALVICGALHVGNAYSSPGSARKIVVVSGGDDDEISFTVTGTDIEGNALVETFLGANAGTATSTKYFQTVSGISAVGDPAGTVTAGTSAEALDKVFFGRTRLKGYSIVSGGTAGVVSFINGSPNDSGSTIFKARTLGTDNTTVDNTIPDEGVLFENGMYVAYNNTTVDMMTYFFA
jgi:hypothetical protein